MVGTLVGAFFGNDIPTNFDEAKLTNEKMYASFFHAMLREGVHLPPSPFEAWFLSSQHDEAVVDAICAAADRAFATAGTLPA